MSLGTHIYRSLPVWAQHGAVSAYGAYWRRLRFGPGYGSFVQDYVAREKYTHAEWQVWQQLRLTEILKTAATQVPYYRSAWRQAETRAALAGDLQGVPLLEKEPIRAQPLAFLSDGVRSWPRLTYHTSGSTGTPVQTIWKIREIRNSLALREARSARWAGVSFEMPRATFSGRMVEPDPQSSGPFHRFNAAEKQVYFSPFHIRPDTARQYVDALREHNVQWMTGYAMSYYLLGQLILDQGIQAPKIRAVITTSEKLTPSMRDVIERAYQTRVYEEYSTVESSLFASECEHGRLHLSPDVAVVEILRPNGTPCDPGEPGEVVATSLIRNYQLFIRYRLGDVAAWDTDSCPCGRAMPILKEVVGRLEDVVVGPDGRLMVRFHGIFVDQPHIREGQIIQDEIDHIHVKVVPADGFCEADVRDVVRRVQQRLSSSVSVDVETVSSIPRSKAGKFQAVINRIPAKGARKMPGPETAEVGGRTR
jgi:phenylacetate-CoA ligase